MDVEFADDGLEKLEADPAHDGGWGRALVRGFRKVMQLIRAAKDERDFYAMKSLHFEKLKGNRKHQRSMRLNDQWRLIVEIKEAKPKNVVRVMKIEDYH
jgi:proteic killer suppression protein